MCLRPAEFIADHMNFLSKQRKLIFVLVTGVFLLAAIGFIRGIGNFSDSKQSRSIECNGKTCNVIMIISDALSAQHMSVYGYERDTTPFIKDYFENNGLIFESASSTASWTLPSFASIFRSRYPSEITFRELAQTQDPNTFVDVLRRNNVEVVGLVDEGQLIKESIANVFRQEEKLAGERETKFLSAGYWLNERIEEGANRPFFMLLHDWTVHDPYDPPERYRQMYGEPEKYQGSVQHDEIEQVKKNGFDSEAQRQKFIRRYDQGVRYFDDLFKDFINSLPQEVLDSSIIILTSDHGEGFNEHGFFYHGAHVYEEFVHVPLLFRFPGNMYAQKRVTQSVSLIDIAPTVLKIFGHEPLKSYQGIDLLPTLEKGELLNNRGMIISELGSFVLSLGDDTKSFKQIGEEQLKGNIFEDRERLAVRKGGWKVIKKGLSDVELYDVYQDKLEKNNLINNWREYDSDKKSIIGELMDFIK